MRDSIFDPSLREILRVGDTYYYERASGRWPVEEVVQDSLLRRTRRQQVVELVHKYHCL